MQRKRDLALVIKCNRFILFQTGEIYNFKATLNEQLTSIFGIMIVVFTEKRP